MVTVTAHTDLTPDDLTQLRRLFDAEYRESFGEWHPDLPFGYAPHDVHVLAHHEGEIVGHVGWARRTISVGAHEIVIAGVGGVLILESARGHHLGRHLMARTAESMRDSGGIAFGYLGCREDVVPFYASCGWTRISATERSIDRSGHPTVDPPGPPLLILPIGSELTDWPDGEIDLRGRAW